MTGLGSQSGVVHHGWTAVRTVALVILRNLDLEAAGIAVNVTPVVVVSEVGGGCSLVENSSWCNVTSRPGSCWQKSAAAVTY